jgi:hypothetical protein
MLLSLWWIIGMAAAGVLDGVPEPLVQFKVPAKPGKDIVVLAPALTSKDEVLAYVRKLDCRNKAWACVDTIVINGPLRTMHPRTALYAALAVAVPGIALIFGFAASWLTRGLAKREYGLANALVVSTAAASLAVFAEVLIAVTIAIPTTFAELFGVVALVCGFLCIVLFLFGLRQFKWKALWLALPVIVAFALPVGLVVYLASAHFACERVHRACEI